MHPTMESVTPNCRLSPGEVLRERVSSLGCLDGKSLPEMSPNERSKVWEAPGMDLGTNGLRACSSSGPEPLRTACMW